jgi:hypothetical protein
MVTNPSIVLSSFGHRMLQDMQATAGFDFCLAWS